MHRVWVSRITPGAETGVATYRGATAPFLQSMQQTPRTRKLFPAEVKRPGSASPDSRRS
jgi:hypothetical protein